MHLPLQKLPIRWNHCFQPCFDVGICKLIFFIDFEAVLKSFLKSDGSAPLTPALADSQQFLLQLCQLLRLKKQMKGRIVTAHVPRWWTMDMFGQDCQESNNKVKLSSRSFQTFDVLVLINKLPEQCLFEDTFIKLPLNYLS